MPYFKYSTFWPDNSLNKICYYWEVGGGGTESATTTCMFGDKGQTSSSSCKTKYQKLPQSLKSCLDYCAVISDIHKFGYFESIEKDELVRLMVAEGIIEEKAGEGDAFSLEEIASSFIDELILLDMLSPEFQLPCWRSITRIKVSEAYSKLCVVEGNRDDFVARNSHSPIRVFVSPDDANDISPCLKNLPIQSLFWSHIFRQPSQATIDTIRGMQSLLVLQIFAIKPGISFNGVGEMANLRYLTFHCQNKFLPTLGNLQNLRTLEMSGGPSDFNLVLEEIMHMKTLRHLLLWSFRLPKGIGGLVNLQTLVRLDGRFDFIGELRSLTQMRRLHVCNVVDETINELLEAIMTMKNLISLFMTAHYFDHQNSLIQVFPFLEPFSPPPLLQELQLDGILMELPNWFASMKNLTSLSLIGSSLSENSSTILQSLPKLKCLCLGNAYKAKLIGKEFCGAGGFSKLEILKIESDVLVGWNEIVFGAFPSLTSLTCVCKNLRFFPEGLQNIFSLQELRITVHADLMRRLEGDENYKIKHIPSIHKSIYLWI